MTDADTETETDIDDNEPDMSELAERVIDELDPGQTIGDKIVLSRRQLVAIAGGGLSLGALGTFGVSDAQAQSAVGTIGTASSPVDVEAASVNAGSVNTEEGEVTNETFIRATRSSQTAATSSGTFVNLYSGESKDNRDEFSSSAQFSPDKDGDYGIVARFDIRGSTSTGDQLIIRIQNVTDSSKVDESKVNAAAPSGAHESVFVENLDSSKTYEIQGTNLDSSFKVTEFNSTGVIKRSVVQ